MKNDICVVFLTSGKVLQPYIYLYIFNISWILGHLFCMGIFYNCYLFQALPLSSLPLTCTKMLYYHLQNPRRRINQRSLMDRLQIYSVNKYFDGMSFFMSESESVQVFFILCLYMLLEIQLSRWEWDPINKFNLPHCCACPKQGSGFLKSHVMVFFLCSVFS